MLVREYIREDGSSPFKQWFDGLSHQAAAKVSVALARLEMGNTSNVKWLTGIGEYRINWGPGYRIYLTKEGHELIILFGGGTKKRQKIDISKASDLAKEYRLRRELNDLDP